MDRGKVFGMTRFGQRVYSFTLTNQCGLSAEIITYGATLRCLTVPNSQGDKVDVVLGCDTIHDYESSTYYLGCIVGRVANRIRNGRFELDGKNYQLNINNGPNHLHGGLYGFNRKVWEVKHASENVLVLTHFSPDGDEHYPGALEAEAIYRINPEKCDLMVELKAKALKISTPVNLTNHSYFNLAGESSGDIFDVDVQINADHFLPIDDDHLVTGEIRSVDGPVFDFRGGADLGRRLQTLRANLVQPGFDNYFCLSEQKDQYQPDVSTGTWAAKFSSEKSKICMSVSTTNPGFQFYTGDFLDEKAGKKGVNYGKNSGFCIETQGYPDAVNHSDFPSIILRPGQIYHHVTSFSFSII